MRDGRRGRWVCIDGIEGAGKTTVTTALATQIDSRLINEFSDAPFGRALREAVRESPHYISGSPLGQSLVFIGDFIELYETSIVPALEQGHLVLTDRGWLSKYAYQCTVLEKSMPLKSAEKILSDTLGLIPRPDFTVLLNAPLTVLRGRLLARDGHCDSQRVAFMTAAARNTERFLASDGELPWIPVDADRDRDTVLGSVLEAVQQSV